MKFGVNVWSFPRETPVEEAMEIARRVGYRGFEPAIVDKHLSMSRDELCAHWNRVHEIAESIGMEIPSIATGLFWRVNPLLELEKALKIVEVEALVAHILGARVVLLVPGTALPELSLAECMSRAREFLKKASAIARDYGIVIGVENVWNRFLAGPEDMAKLLEGLDREVVKLYLDVGNTLPHSLPVHWLDKFGLEAIAQIHVKDFNLAELRFGIPLSGDVPWKHLAERLRSLGYRGYLVAEVPPYRGHPYKAIEDTLTSLRAIFGEGS